jgi:hypothetical protein
MMSARPFPRIVAWSIRVYEVMVRAYPEGFRREYGLEMAQVFRMLCHDRYRRAGAWGVLRLWPGMFGDWLRTTVLLYLACPRDAVRCGMVGGAMLAFGLAVYGPVAYPASVDADTLTMVAICGLVLALYAVVAVRLSRSRLDLQSALGCGLAVGALWALYNLIDTLSGIGAQAYDALALLTTLGTLGLCALAGLLGAHAHRRFDAGIRACACAALIGMLMLTISGFLVTYPFMDAVQQINRGDPGFLRSGMRDVTAWTIRDDLDGFTIMLIIGPLCGIAAGAAASLVGKGRRMPPALYADSELSNAACG